MSEFLTKHEIRNLVDCPFCGAQRGRACFHTGNGSVRKNRAGANHNKRMYAAQDLANARPADELIDEGDVIEVNA